MDPKLLFVKCITLLYRESELDQAAVSTDLCQKVIDNIKLPESTMEVHSGREVLVGLRATVMWMIEKPASEPYDKTQLLQRVRINTKDDSYLYNAVVDGLQKIDDKEELQKQILSYRSELKRSLNQTEIDGILKQAFQKVMFGTGGKTDYQEMVRDICAKLEPYTHSVLSSAHPSVVDSVNFEDPEAMEDLLGRSKEEVSADGVIRTGYQAINRMLGKQGGFRRGEMVLVGALQHNYKTGFTLNIFKHAALYNKPYMRDEAKKPLLIHLSLENELSMNIMSLYISLKENETGEICDATMVDVNEAAAYIRERMGVNGYNIKMLRVDPNRFSYHDLFDMVTNYESEGYEIHMIVCDYLNMASKKGCSSGPAGFEIRDLFRRTRNFIAPRGITFVTPHQLSTEAKGLTRQGVENFVQEIANKGYYDSCKTIDQEVDLEIAIHIEKIAGRGSFLTVQRGKHRKVDITPTNDLFTVLPFFEAGGVRDDVDGGDQSMKTVGGQAEADGGAAWYDQ
jgi:hypothetical protein